MGEKARQSVFGAAQTVCGCIASRENCTVLDQMVPPIAPKTDNEFIRHIRIRSELLSRFWGRDVFIGAHILVPKGFDAHPQSRYPLMVFHGHYPDDISGFRTTPPDPHLSPDYSERFHLAGYNRIQQQEAYAFYQKWISADFPRFLVVEIEHANPYYDDSYAVNSRTSGLRRRHQQGTDSRDRAGDSAASERAGRASLRRFNRRMGGSGHAGVLSRHVQRRICGLPGSDRLSRLHPHQLIQGTATPTPAGRSLDGGASCIPQLLGRGVSLPSSVMRITWN